MCLEEQVMVAVIQASCRVLTETIPVLPSGGEASMVRKFLEESAVSLRVGGTQDPSIQYLVSSVINLQR